MARDFRLSALSVAPIARVEGLRIYLDGDGQPWRNNRPADNPSGSGKLVISMMVADTEPALYLSRPCYYLDELPNTCTTDLWTNARYSVAIIDAVADALAQLIDKTSAQRLTLVGYSGGGVIALLAAEQLEVPTKVITVAAPIDTEAWTAFHDFLPLDSSLNPADLDFSASEVEQLHLLGGRDKVVPPETISRFRANNPQATYLTFDQYDHVCCWLENWPSIVSGY